MADVRVVSLRGEACVLEALLGPVDMPEVDLEDGKEDRDCLAAWPLAVRDCTALAMVVLQVGNETRSKVTLGWYFRKAQHVWRSDCIST